MGRREGRKATRKDKAQDIDSGSRELVAVGRISGGVSVTHIPFRSMPTADEICTTAVRRVTRAVKTHSAQGRGRQNEA